MRTTYDSYQESEAVIAYLNAIIRALHRLMENGYRLSNSEMDFISGIESSFIRPTTWQQMPLETRQNIAQLRIERDRFRK